MPTGARWPSAPATCSRPTNGPKPGAIRSATGSGPTPVVCRRPDGSAAAIIPLVGGRERGLRVLRLIGHGPSDQLAPICAAGDRPQVAETMRRYLGASRADLFIGEQMPAEERWSAALGARVLATEASPVLEIGDLDWEGFLAGRSRNFRQQVRRRERKLAAAGKLEFRLCDDPARLDADLETLFSLHDARWAAGARTRSPLRDARCTGNSPRRRSTRGWLRLWLLQLDGRPLAAWYGFRFAEADWYYQSGRDPDASAENVGFVLLSHTMREAFADRMREYRLLRGDEEYKGRFASDDPGLETVALPLSARGRAALLATACAPRRRRRCVGFAAASRGRIANRHVFWTSVHPGGPTSVQATAAHRPGARPRADGGHVASTSRTRQIATAALTLALVVPAAADARRGADPRSPRGEDHLGTDRDDRQDLGGLHLPGGRGRPGFAAASTVSAIPTCASPKTYSGLPAGQHRFVVRAVGRAAKRRPITATEKASPPRARPSVDSRSNRPPTPPHPRPRTRRLRQATRRRRRPQSPRAPAGRSARRTRASASRRPNRVPGSNAASTASAWAGLREPDGLLIRSRMAGTRSRSGRPMPSATPIRARPVRVSPWPPPARRPSAVLAPSAGSRCRAPVGARYSEGSPFNRGVPGSPAIASNSAAIVGRVNGFGAPQNITVRRRRGLGPPDLLFASLTTRCSRSTARSPGGRARSRACRSGSPTPRAPPRAVMPTWP